MSGSLSGLRIAVGLSGGVDSSVTAALLVSEGARVTGLTMRVWDGSLPVDEGAKHACYGPGEDEDIAACETLCRALGIAYRVVDLRAEYRARVIDYFKGEYLRGRTPNPCVRCNHDLKFGFLLAKAREEGLDFDLFATGHYARIDGGSGWSRLRAATRADKDQTYFLHRLGPRVLDGVVFPLGAMSKDEVRARARELGLESAGKPDSQDFVAGGDYSAIFAGSGAEPGDFVDEEGTVLGRHRGIVHYTVGQRRGIGLSSAPAPGEDPVPLYVTRIDAERNRVVVAPDRGLWVDGIDASDLVLNLPDSDPETLRPTGTREFRAIARVRQNHRGTPCRARAEADGSVRLRFDSPVRAAAPGQSAALYDEEGFVLGGAIIERGFRDEG